MCYTISFHALYGKRLGPCGKPRRLLYGPYAKRYACELLRERFLLFEWLICVAHAHMGHMRSLEASH